jgi:hypothetical protein
MATVPAQQTAATISDVRQKANPHLVLININLASKPVCTKEYTAV